jgi:predicted RNase H-like HicB family nuclease
MPSVYDVRYTHDTRDTTDGWWYATVDQVTGCHTQGRTLDDVRRRVRIALALFVSDADDATFREHLHDRLNADGTPA